MKILKKIVKAILILIVIFMVGFIGLIVYATISDYKPEEMVTVAVSESPSLLSDTAELTLMTWNIGYCGLDRDMDFFYDGGKKVFTTKEQCVKNLSAAMSFIRGNDSIDFILLRIPLDPFIRNEYLLSIPTSLLDDRFYRRINFSWVNFI